MGKHTGLFIMLHGDACFGRGNVEQDGVRGVGCNLNKGGVMER